MELGLLRSLDRNLTCLNLDGTNGEVDGIARSECGRQPVCGELLICVENQQFATHRSTCVSLAEKRHGKPSIPSRYVAVAFRAWPACAQPRLPRLAPGAVQRTGSLQLRLPQNSSRKVRSRPCSCAHRLSGPRAPDLSPPRRDPRGRAARRSIRIAGTLVASRLGSDWPLCKHSAANVSIKLRGKCAGRQSIFCSPPAKGPHSRS